MALRHSVTATGSNDGTKQVSVTAWNADHTVDSGGITMSNNAGVPATPAAGTLVAFSSGVAGRSMLSQIGPSGFDTWLQPSIARNKIAFWNSAGNTTTAPVVEGLAVFSAVGTVTARNVAATNILTRSRRMAYVSAATAGSLAGQYQAVAQFTTGDGAGLGGFTFVARFGTSDAATVSGARFFCGLTSSIAAPTNVEPSTLTNAVGVAQLSTDATQWYIVYGGSAAQTAIALGTALGAPTLTTTVFELVLFASAASNGNIGYRVTNHGTGAYAEGTLTATTPGTQTPLNSTFLAPRIWRSNNATAAAVGYDLVIMYLETDD